MDHPLFKYRNLEEAMNAVGGPVNMLRSSDIGPFVFPRVPPEYSNWKDEQRAWMNDVALLNLSFHMTHSYLKGPDALKFLKYLGCNKFGDFPINRAKQLILASHDGYLIGDAIVFHTSDDVYRISGAPVASDWLQFHAKTGDCDIEYERDDNLFFRSGEPLLYVYQIQGPHATALIQDVCDGDLPEIKFFHIGEFSILGKPVRALRHGMAGVPGLELFGPWSDHQVIMEKLEKAGAKYKMRKVGGRAYPSTCLESGWLSLPCPAIYHSAEMKPYREWMTPGHLEVLGSLGGSFAPANIVDYYMDPVEVGYGPLIDRDNHDCIGHDALVEKLKNPKRKKVTLVFNQEDVARAMAASVFGTDKPAKYMDMPRSIYSTFHYDAVMKDGQQVGVCTFSGVSANANEMLGLAVVAIEHAEPGAEVEMLWGEPGSQRPTVEKNVMYTIRAKVAPVPYFTKTNKNL
jgi:vanillate/3-O-methylgallate O-demethylase